MGSKYSSELKQEHNHDPNVASTSFSKVNNESTFESTNIFNLLGCWKCICFKPRNLRAGKNRVSIESLNNNNNKAFSENANKNGSENHAMQFKSEEEKWCKNFADSQVEIYQNNQNVVLAESSFEAGRSRHPIKQRSFENKRPNAISLSQKTLNYAKRSMSLKSCKASFGSSISGNNGVGSDIKKNFLSKLVSLSVDCKQRLGYVKQVDTVEPSSCHDFKNCGQGRDGDDVEEDKNEQDELLDHGRYSFDGELDFLRPIDSMEYLDSTPSTEDKFTEACLKFQNRNDNLSSELYEESCLDNLESFCDKSILLASMDTIDLGSSTESLLPTSQDNVGYDRSPIQNLENYVLLDIDTYRSLMDELETCKEILKQLEVLVSNIIPPHQEVVE